MRPLNPGRFTALLYLLAGATAFFSYMYPIPTLIAPRDAAATAHNILASETLFRLGIVSELVSSIAFIFLVLSMYRLFKSVDRTKAIVMVILVLVSIPISLLNAANLIAVLRLLKGGASLAAIGTSQLQAMAMLFLRAHDAGIFIAQIFWGLWLLPLGMLVRRSGFVPRIFGTLLIFNGLAYPIVTLVWLLAPSYAATAIRLALLPQLGEAWFILWLLIKGVPAQAAEPRHAVSAMPQLAGAMLISIAIASSALAGEVVKRGAAIPPDARRVPLASVLAKPGDFANQPIVVEGVVEKVCWIAGCWMKVAPTAGATGIHVTFKQGAFVVPRDSRGSKARLFGVVKLTEKKASFVATGLELTRSPE